MGLSVDIIIMSYGVELIDATPKWLDIPFLATYLVYGERDVLIDSGVKSSSEKLIRSLSGRDFSELDYVITHIHIDHVSGLGYVHEKFKGSIYLHPRAVKHVADPSKLWTSAKATLDVFAEMYGEPKPVDEKYLIPVSDGGAIPPREDLITIYTPGHASHHISIYHSDSNGLFVGDSAGIFISQIDYIIPTTIYPCKLDLYMSSLRKMMDYRPSIIYYAHYGISEGGWRNLNQLYSMLENWIRIASDSKSLDDFRRYILDEDELFRKVYIEMDKYPLAKLLVDLAIRGVYEEVKHR